MARTPKRFDPDLYAQKYPDVALSGIDPERHFQLYGRHLGRNPAPAPANPVMRRREYRPDLLDAAYARGVVASDAPLWHRDLVSVIMPNCNNEAWIARAMHSVLSQEGVNVELLVIDDGSTDNSVAIAREIAKGRRNVHVIALLRNFGCYYARNVGLLHARGAWVTIVDSDDIVPPDRLLRQLDALRANPDRIACLGTARRWNADFTKPLNDLRHAENSLLWSRNVLDRIGYYDSVRFAGDTEFRRRLKQAYGEESILLIPDEVYYLRTVEGSLATSGSTSAVRVENGQLATHLSRERREYETHFRQWQRAAAPTPDVNAAGLRMPFPLLERPFRLGGPGQDAAPSLGQRRVGAMASFPPRRDSLKAAIASVLPQLDLLILYLNNYDDIPDCAIHPNIRVIRSQEAAGDLRDNGKFYDLPQDDDCYVFTFDDDLAYPPDYVARLIHYIEMLGRSCVVGLHGVIFPEGEFTNLRQRIVQHFIADARGQFVDLLGTGTTAWHSSALKPRLEDFTTTGVCDLWLAAKAARERVPMFSIPRPPSWVTQHHITEETLFNEAQSRQRDYVGLFNSAIAPALRNGAVRKAMERHLARSFGAETIAAAGIDLREPPTEHRLPQGPLRRPLSLHDVLAPERAAAPPVAEIHFHIVVNGWNCRGDVDACLRSIACQVPGPYTHEVTLVDDGSDDGTYERLAAATVLPFARLLRIERNAGPAHARHVGISAIESPDTVVVLVDMDDTLEPEALRVVADRYLRNPRCLMTIGNWRDQNGELNPQPFYSAEELDSQQVRAIEMFHATHLRTFRRRLYDAVTPADLLDQDGKWLETCTDVALLYPLLDQCWSDEVEFISRPIYRYNRRHDQGTLARFGKTHKEIRLAWIKSKPPKPRLNPNAPPRLTEEPR